jgi:hypothetical protein
MKLAKNGRQYVEKINNQIDGEFDAAIKLPPKSQNQDYLSGYFSYTAKTGNTPF